MDQYEGLDNIIKIEKLKTDLSNEKERRQFAENELALIKATGMNSNEMRDAKKEIENLKKEIALVREDAQIEILNLKKINQSHKSSNGKLQLELTRLKGGM